MIYGIIASAEESFGGGITFPGLLGQFDFIGGTYLWGDTVLAASDIIDQTGWIGATGLAIPGSSGAAAEILYSGITNLLAACDFTAVFEIETLNTSTADILTVYDDTDTYMIHVLADGGAGGYYEIADYGSDSRYIDEMINGLTVGIHKIAVTTTSDRISLSVDGNTFVTDATSNTLPVIGSPMTKFYLGGVYNHTYAAIRIRSMDFYETRTDFELQSLSAL